MAPEHPLAVHYIIHENLADFPGNKGEPILSHPQNKNDISPLTLHLYQPSLIDIPALALQGWLDLALAVQVIKCRPTEGRFNFKREILPLINVSGMATQVMRYLVFQLEISLQQVMAVKLILDMAHDQSLLYYFYFRIAPSEEDEKNYKNLVPHHWTRSIFLCKKLRQHTSVALLARQGEFVTLNSFWWSCHDYFLPEDRNLIEELAEISHRFEQMSFSDQLVAMFKKLKTHLLT